MRRWGSALVGPGCLLALLLSCFGPVLFLGEQFAYRDAGHFYYPLYQRVQEEWAAGRLPLWEPEENAGMPLLGNPTAAVLYPGKVIYALAPSYAWGARLYVIAHTLLAVAGMFALLRHWGIGRAGAGLGALGFGFGAPVLFQYCNVIFLVGAAWTPLGLRAADRWLRLGRRWAIGELAIVVAMQALGGDPQAAYLTGLCAGGYAVGLAWWGRADRAGGPARRQVGLIATAIALAWIAGTLVAARYCPGLRPKPKNPGEPPQVVPWTPFVAPVVTTAWLAVGLVFLRRAIRRPSGRALLGAIVGLGAAGALAFALAAAQLLPVFEFSAMSLRASSEGPHDVYPFSFEPYRLVELAWPNVFGTTGRGNHSWMSLVPPRVDHQVWVPSIYGGGLALALAVGAFGFRQGPPWRAWLSSIALVSLLVGFGEFASPLLWARSLPSGAAVFGPHDPVDTTAVRLDGYLRDGDGSPYWVLATFLPGFGQFRYPSKLLTFTALALSGLAGLGWDRVVAGSRRKTCAIAAGALVASLVALGLGLTYRGPIEQWFEAAKPGMGLSPFGPFEPHGAFADACRATAQAGLVAAIGLGILSIAPSRPRLSGGLALALMAADLAAANAPLVRTVLQSEFEGTPRVVQIIRDHEKAHPGPPGPYRVHRMPVWNPYRWLEEGSDDRVRDFIRWERDTIQPKYGITEGVEYTITEGTTELYDYHWFFGPFPRKARAEVARVLGIEVGKEFVYFPRRGFDLWNTRYFVVPAVTMRWEDEHRGFASFLMNTERIYPPPDAFEGPGGQEAKDRWVRGEDFQVRRNKAAFPRAWVVHQARFRDPIRSMEKAGRGARMMEMLYQEDPLWLDPTMIASDPREVAWVEAEPDDRATLAAALPGGGRDEAEAVEVVESTPRRVELSARLNRPGLVVLADVFYPGWTLTIDGAPATIWRTNRLMRGAIVPSGTHRLVYTYGLRSVRTGLLVSACGLAALLGVGVWSALRPRVGRGLGGQESAATKPEGDFEEGGLVGVVAGASRSDVPA